MARAMRGTVRSYHDARPDEPRRRCEVMGNGTQATTNASWTSTQAYVLAIICLAVGVAGGYFVRGSAGPADATAAAVPQQQMQATAMPQGQGEPTPEQLKHMADQQAAPLLEAVKANPKDAQALAQLG